MAVTGAAILSTRGAATALVMLALAITTGVSGQATASQINCPPPIEPVRDLDLPGYYKDKAKSVVDPTAEARKRAAVKPLKDYLNAVTMFADRAVLARPQERRAGYGHCAVFWLRTWAEGRAYLGAMGSKQAEAQRKWDLAGLALAYLKVRRYAGPIDRRIIDPWLQDIADRARAIYDSPGKVRNNHWYWLGLGLGAVGLVTDSGRHWHEARRIMQDAANDIGPNGYLPKELKRGKRALHYHTFSAMPLIAMAQLARAKNEDWAGLGNGALHRLVKATAEALINPARIELAAGVRQERPLRPRAGWLQLYRFQFPEQSLPRTLPASKPRHRWLGGDVLALTRALSPAASSN